jgi:hypothetical protein
MCRCPTGWPTKKLPRCPRPKGGKPKDVDEVIKVFLGCTDVAVKFPSMAYGLAYWPFRYGLRDHDLDDFRIGVNKVYARMP